MPDLPPHAPCAPWSTAWRHAVANLAPFARTPLLQYQSRAWFRLLPSAGYPKSTTVPMCSHSACGHRANPIAVVPLPVLKKPELHLFAALLAPLAVAALVPAMSSAFHPPALARSPQY